MKGIDLVLEEGKFYGLLGPNGAGKTTLFNLLIQNFKQSSGDISWEVDGHPLSVKDFYHHIGIVFQSNRLDENLTVERTRKDGTTFIVPNDEYLEKSLQHIENLGFFRS